MRRGRWEPEPTRSGRFGFYSENSLILQILIQTTNNPVNCLIRDRWFKRLFYLFLTEILEHDFLVF